MAQKRPFDDEVVNEVSLKHQRQDRPRSETILCNGSSPREDRSEKRFDSGEDSIRKGVLQLREGHENGSCPKIPGDSVEEIGSDLLRSASLSHWATCSTSDDDGPSEELVHLPFFPAYFSFEHPLRSVINPSDLYYCLLDYPPRKRVPVGPDHQADIPVWGTQGNEDISDASGKTIPASSDRNPVGNDDGELGGLCIMLNPEIEPPAYNGERVGDSRIECRCPDQGSIRCVRRHIAEARDKLRRTLGQDAFVELGFNDMGEVVAEKWSEEEEQLFHEVVYSNPVSLGKNFWNVLSAVFYSRTKMEIVSYYFNVFMLRKRAEQNRCDPMNIDSDDDKCPGIDDGDGGNGTGVSEENENSGIESLLHHDDIECHRNGLHEDEHEHEHELEQDHEHEHEYEDNGDLLDKAREADVNNGEGHLRKSDLDSTFELPGKNDDDDGGDNNVQDGS